MSVRLQSCRFDHCRTSTVRRRVSRALILRALLALSTLLLLINLQSACLEVAECDSSFPCEGEQLCFDFRCTNRCTTDAQCPDPLLCIPCDTPDGVNNRDNRCLGEEGNGCASASLREEN